MNKSKMYLGYAGHCLSKEHHAISGGSKKDIVFNALWGLIEHPNEGYILYDTGYSTRFYKATKHYPYKIYAQITKVFITANEEVQAQLKAAGITSESIKHIVISHFHADHIGGLKDFPNATFHASQEAVDQFNKIPKILGFTKGILKELVPDNFMERISFLNNKTKVKLPILGECFDVFGDGHLIAVPLTGHAAGQIGLLVATAKRSYFLIADACWLQESYKKGVLPSSMVRLFFYSWKQFKSSLKKITDYHLKHPETIIVPTHCEKTTNPLVQSKINMNDL